MSEITEMDREFYEYLENIEITEENLLKRILDIFIFYSSNICPEKIQDIFVTDYISEESREYENLWFFSENYAMESKRFISEDYFDIAKIREISVIDITKTEYDYIKPNDKSKLNLFCDTETVNFQMRASKENCNHLKNIIKKYFIERL